MDKDNREKLAEQFRPLVFYILREYGIYEDNRFGDDFVEAGLIGLTNAINKYEKGGGCGNGNCAEFGTFAYGCIDRLVKNEMKRHGTYGAMFRKGMLSLDHSYNDDFSLGDIVVDDRIGPYEDAEKGEDISLMMELVDGLPAMNKMIVRLRYFEGMTFDNIAELVNERFGKTSQRAVRHACDNSLNMLRWWLGRSGFH